MTAEVKEIRPGIMQEVNDDVVLAPDSVLENNKGLYKKVFLIGVNERDELILAGSHSINEMYVHLGLSMREIEDRVTGKK